VTSAGAASSSTFVTEDLSMATALSNDQLLRLARPGASARIAELRAEIAAIEAAFPDLARDSGGRARKSGSASLEAGGGEVRRTGRRGWNAAQRKAAADRMRAYWAKRRKKG
jgi:hypothetical protein